MSRARLFLVALLVIGAGCLGPQQAADTSSPPNPGATDSTPVGTDTADEISPEGTATASIPNGSVAPGVTDQGIQNSSRLLDFHTRSLRERGFELVIERRVSSDDQTRTVEYRRTATPALRQYRQQATMLVAGSQTVHRSWLNATMERMLTQVESDGETQYRIPPVGPAGSEARTHRLQQLVLADQLAPLLQGGTFEITDVNETGETDRYRLVGTNFATDGRYGERDVHLTIDGDGVIHTLNATGTQSRGGSFSVSYRVTRLGVDSIDRPDWVASAPAPIDTRPTVGFENCTKPYLTIDNPGPDTIPPDTVVTVTLNETDYRVPLDASVAPNERRALYLTASGTLEDTATDAVPVDRTGMPNEAEFTVTTNEGLLLSSGAIGFGCETASEGGGAGRSSSRGAASTG